MRHDKYKSRRDRGKGRVQTVHLISPFTIIRDLPEYRNIGRAGFAHHLRNAKSPPINGPLIAPLKTVPPSR